MNTTRDEQMAQKFPSMLDKNQFDSTPAGKKPPNQIKDSIDK